MHENYISLSAFEKKGSNIDHLRMFNAIDFDHFVLPVLHVLLGLGNDIYKNILTGMQAGFEVYTNEYVALERAWIITTANHQDAKDEKAEQEQLYGNYTKYLNLSSFLATQILLW
jgi:hypothetical protein